MRTHERVSDSSIGAMHTLVSGLLAMHVSRHTQQVAHSQLESLRLCIPGNKENDGGGNGCEDGGQEPRDHDGGEALAVRELQGK